MKRSKLYDRSLKQERVQGQIAGQVRKQVEQQVRDLVQQRVREHVWDLAWFPVWYQVQRFVRHRAGSLVSLAIAQHKIRSLARNRANEVS